MCLVCRNTPVHHRVDRRVISAHSILVYGDFTDHLLRHRPTSPQRPCLTWGRKGCQTLHRRHFTEHRNKPGYKITVWLSVLGFSQSLTTRSALRLSVHVSKVLNGQNGRAAGRLLFFFFSSLQNCNRRRVFIRFQWAKTALKTYFNGQRFSNSRDRRRLRETWEPSIRVPDLTCVLATPPMAVWRWE